jgi:hypothetical protein
MADPLERLRHPKPGSAIAAARDYGIDLTLIIQRLQESPTKRLQNLQMAMKNAAAIQAAMRQSRDRLGKGVTASVRE